MRWLPIREPDTDDSRRQLLELVRQRQGKRSSSRRGQALAVVHQHSPPGSPAGCGRRRRTSCSSTASISRTSTSRPWRCGPRCTSQHRQELLPRLHWAAILYGHVNIDIAHHRRRSLGRRRPQGDHGRRPGRHDGVGAAHPRHRSHLTASWPTCGTGWRSANTHRSGRRAAASAVARCPIPRPSIAATTSRRSAPTASKSLRRCSKSDDAILVEHHHHDALHWSWWFFLANNDSDFGGLIGSFGREIAIPFAWDRNHPTHFSKS